MKKFNGVKVVGIVGTVLGVAATLVSNWTQQKTMDETIKKEVEKALTSKSQ